MEADPTEKADSKQMPERTNAMAGRAAHSGMVPHTTALPDAAVEINNAIILRMMSGDTSAAALTPDRPNGHARLPRW